MTMSMNHGNCREQSQYQQCLKLRIRPFVLIGTAATCCVYFVVMLYFYVTEDCNSSTYRNFICDHYQHGVIDGGLCKRLCDDVHLHKIQLSQCLYSNVQYTVFYWRERVNGKSTELQLKMPTTHMDHAGLKYDPGRSPYSQPARGTSMDQFRDMVVQFVDDKVGPGDHKKLVDHIMDVADVNHDQKVSLAEAKSIWALLQHNEFFVTLVFANSEYIPQLRGFCGDLYAMEHVHTTYLYRKNADSYLSAVLPELYKWTYPEWEHRAKVMVGMLEFTMDAFQHQSDGTFFMCSLSEETVGYSATYDVKLSDGSQMLSQQELSMYLADITCNKDSDCQYTRVCSSQCDARTATCFQEITLPTLYHVCQIMKDYLFQGIPPDVATELRALLYRCDKLNIQAELEHSLLLNDLKSLLWNKISYKRVR